MFFGSDSLEEVSSCGFWELFVRFGLDTYSFMSS